MLKHMKAVKNQTLRLMTKEKVESGKTVMKSGLEKLQNTQPDLLHQDPMVKDCYVTVMSGSSSKEFPVANLKVSDVRKLLKGAINIADNAVAQVNSKVVTEDYVVKAKDRLEFIRQAGVKGS